MRMKKSDIDYDEVIEAVSAVKSGTAPGEEGLPAEWVKAVFCENRKAPSPTLMVKWLFQIMKKIWRCCEIPEQLRCETIVPISKSGGNPQDANNFRGISLMAVSMKVLLKLLTHQFNTIVENIKLLSKEEAGLRPHRDCKSPDCSLVEVAQRRRLMGKRT